MLPLLFLALPIICMAALVGGGWGLLTRSMFRGQGRWPALLLLLLSLAPPTALVWDWPQSVSSAIALDASNNSPAALAAA